MHILITLLVMAYIFVFLVVTSGILLIDHSDGGEKLEAVSVVVVAKNEEKNLPLLLDSLEDQSYPKDYYEVILVDDDSCDETGGIMQKYANQHGNWKKLKHKKQEGKLRGKKGALNYAIHKAQGNIILTTDADCEVRSGWIQSMVQQFSDNVGMVLGYSPVKKDGSWFNYYQRSDSLCEGALAAATAYFDRPTHSNARNMAFRKKAFQEIGGYGKYGEIDTGDDFYLSKKIQEETSYEFKYNTDPVSFVVTDEIGLGQEYIHQQLRRNSKSMDLLPVHKISGGIVFLFHLTLIFTLVYPGMGKYFLLCLGGKFLAETIPFLISAVKFKESDLILFYPIFWILYPILFLTFQILGTLKLHDWK